MIIAEKELPFHRNFAQEYPFWGIRSTLLPVMKPPAKPGFTLIELIIVIAIVSVLAAVVFVAVDPARRIQASNNATRWSDVTAIVEAVKHYQGDNRGAFPPTPTIIDSDANTVQIVGSGASVSCSAACAGQTVVGTNCHTSGLGFDLRPYLRRLPRDPNTGVSTTDSNFNSRYYINKDQYGILTVGACDEQGEGVNGSGTPPEIEVYR
jgi:type IV pilus assembly protein PilA